MKNIIVVLLLVLPLSIFAQKGQESIEGTQSIADLYPSKITVELKNTTLYFLLTKTQSSSWRLLVTEDESIIDALRTQSNPKTVVFEAVKYQDKVARKLYKKAQNKSDIDLRLVEPHEVYLIFNSGIKPQSQPSTTE